MRELLSLIALVVAILPSRDVERTAVTREEIKQEVAPQPQPLEEEFGPEAPAKMYTMRQAWLHKKVEKFYLDGTEEDAVRVSDFTRSRRGKKKEAMMVNPRLLKMLARIADEHGNPVIDIISWYRPWPHGVSGSHHYDADAVDFMLLIDPAVAPEAVPRMRARGLAEWIRQRFTGHGQKPDPDHPDETFGVGIGAYSARKGEDEFVHLDVRAGGDSCFVHLNGKNYQVEPGFRRLKPKQRPGRRNRQEWCR